VRLEGKVALITGGGTGIGAAIAGRFVAEGAKVCITGRRQEVLDQTLRSFPSATTVACAGDVSRTSKTGLIMLTQQAAVDFGQYNIRVNAICPGGVKTPMVDGAIHRFVDALSTDEQTVSALVSSDVPMRRMAGPAEIAGTCVYLASDDSSFTTGAVIMVDGGASVVDVGRVAVDKALRDAGAG
jgi:NAD(P)-dependent dehydrogenase (short-subunit alcohol dehydrogenase family)